jgi:hypothetical protein
MIYTINKKNKSDFVQKKHQKVAFSRVSEVIVKIQ